MKNFKVVMVLCGLTGNYTSEFTVSAKTQKSAEKKAWLHVGDRSLVSLIVTVI